MVARTNNNARRLSAVRANGTDSVDWDAKTKEMTAERIMERCLEAMAEGDEEQLASCLLELEEPEEKSTVIESLITKKKEDEFWTKKLQEIAAERVLENCMSAVVRARSECTWHVSFAFAPLLPALEACDSEEE